ncbi:MAG: hypothetical protein KDC49_20975 [Saprospiraceae bacterium]|nr:hypothetical protein [Saprospiraceae bacterium]
MLTAQYVNAQTYTLGTSPAINNATINTCTGTFYDSGGSSANYGNNQDYTVTFCSNNSKPMVVDFTTFALQTGDCSADYLSIYNGPNTSGSLIGTFCGNTSPLKITSSGGATCLTFVFHSDNTTPAQGWAANLSCYQCIDESTCSTQYVDLQFSNPTMVVDATNLIGDTWRFPNVMTGIDALVEIVNAVGVNGIFNIDNSTQPTGKTFAWSPEITIPTNTNGDHYIDWRIRLVNAGGNTPTPLPKASRVTSYDVDGNNSYREIHGHVSPNGYILNNPTELTILNEPPYTMILGSNIEHDGISDDSEVKGTFYYASQLQEFNIRLGIRVQGSNGTPNRQYAVSFEACPSFGNPVTNAIIPVINGDQDICQNELTQVYSLSNTFSNIQWSVNGGTISGPSNGQSVTVVWNSTPGSKVISVVTTDGASCQVSNSKSILVRPQPSAAATGATVCTGQTINLTASGGTSYSWSGPQSFTSTSQNPSIPNATTTMAGTYTVTVTNAFGCSSTATANVIVNTSPTINLTTSTVTICKGMTIAALAYTSTSGSPTTYSIDFNPAANAAGIADIPPGTALPASPINISIPAGIAPGTYTGSLSLANGSCSSTTPQTIMIVVNNPAVVNAGPDLTVCANAASVQVQLTNASVGGGSTTAAWFIISGGGSLSSTAQTGTPSNINYTSPAYIPANGNYAADIVLRLTSSDPDGSGPCPVVFDERLVSVNFITAGTISNSQTICVDGIPQAIGGN